VLSIAGFDPSGGAGVLADIKTFEAHRVTGLGVATGLTFQNDVEIDGVDWLPAEAILRQIDVLVRRFAVQAVKIGIIRDPESLARVVRHLHGAIPRAKIVWDPVLKASAGLQFHSPQAASAFLNICPDFYLMTPNLEEAQFLSGAQDAAQAGRTLSGRCHVFLKGGHSTEAPGRDFLFPKDGPVKAFRAKRVAPFPKHGSGCVLSSAIAANLAKGYDLHRACLRAKTYVTRFLLSSETMVGYHPV
jgi:hydroxymethylpyrimidine/phosphomethylpyrimidine kinase